MKRSLGAVDGEEGISTSLNGQSSFVRGSTFPRIHATLDYGFLLPLDHSSVWFRTAAGYGFGDRASSFAYYYFGGFGNNYVDNGEVKRYREFYSFPGIELNGIGGTDFTRATLEWTLPPIRFRRFGMPSFYCTWARVAFFSSTIVTDAAHPTDRIAAVDIGSQVDFSLVTFSHLDSMLSFGYAVAVQQHQRARGELMISLKLL